MNSKHYRAVNTSCSVVVEPRITLPQTRQHSKINIFYTISLLVCYNVIHILTWM